MTRQELKKKIQKMKKEEVINLFMSNVKQIDKMPNGEHIVVLYEWFHW